MSLDMRFGAGVAIMLYRTTLEIENEKLKAVREEMRAQATVAVAAQNEAVQFFKTQVLGALSKAVDSAIEAAESDVLAKNLGSVRADIRKRMSDSRVSAVVLDGLRAKASREVAKLAELKGRYDEIYARCEAAIPEAKRYIESGVNVPPRIMPFFSVEKSGVGSAMKIDPLALPSQRDAPDPTSTAAMAFLGRVPQK
jgi:hypothetical protein